MTSRTGSTFVAASRFVACESVLAVSLLLALCSASRVEAQPTATGVAAHWSFEEGSFDGASGPSSRTVLDSSGNGNHGYRPSAESRVQYTSDAYMGAYAVEFNSAASGGTEPGMIVIPHDMSVEPATGMIEAWVRIGSFPADPATLFTKSTFQLLRSEPGPSPPIFYPPDVSCPQAGGCPDGRIVGRTVYQLEILPDSRVRATVANDSLDGSIGIVSSPWTTLTSPDGITLDEWNHVAMSWDGCRLEVLAGGVWTGVDFDPIPQVGLSYRAEGVDPTFGPQQLDASMSSSELTGHVDEVRVSEVQACAAFPGQQRPELEPIEPAMLNTLGMRPPSLVSEEHLREAALAGVPDLPLAQQKDDFEGPLVPIPGGGCDEPDCPELRNGEFGDFLRTPEPTSPPFVRIRTNGNERWGGNDPNIAASNAYLVVTTNGLIQFYSKGGDLLQEFGTKNFFKPVWDPAIPNNINDSLNLPDKLPCDDSGEVFAETTFCLDSYYDTRVIFDEYRQRFWITALARNSETRDKVLQQTMIPHTIEEEYAARRSKLLVAVSSSDNPLENWNIYWWNAVLDDGVCTSATIEPCPGSIYMPGDAADYPSIGVSSKYVIITNTVARRDPDDFLIDGEIDGRYQLFHVIDAEGFGEGRGLRTWQFIFNDPNNPSALYRTLTQPAVQHGESRFNIHYLASHVNAESFQVWGFLPGNPPEARVMQKDFKSILGIAQAMPQPNFGANAPSKPVQIRNMGRSIMKTSVRNDRLHLILHDCMRWEAATPTPCETLDTIGSSSIKMLRLNIYDFAFKNIPQTAASGYIERTFGLRNLFDDDESSVVFYGTPAIEANKHGDMVAVYSRAGSGVLPEARYSAYFNNEPDIRPSALLHVGKFPLEEVFNANDPTQVDDNGNPKAVGNLDTGGITVDPYDDEAIWMLHGFSDDNTTSDGPLRGDWKFAIGKVFGQLHPDLIVSEVDVDPLTDSVGQEHTLEATVRNQGDGQAGGSRLRVVLSLDTEISNDDLEVADLIFPGIAAGSDFGAIANFTLSPSLPSGTYYVLAHTDWQNLVVEYSDDNNVLRGEDRLQVDRVAIISDGGPGGPMEQPPPTSGGGKCSAGAADSGFVWFVLLLLLAAVARRRTVARR